MEAALPDEITCSEQVFDVAMHVSSNILAAGRDLLCIDMFYFDLCAHSNNAMM